MPYLSARSDKIYKISVVLTPKYTNLNEHIIKLPVILFPNQDLEILNIYLQHFNQQTIHIYEYI